MDIALITDNTHVCQRIRSCIPLQNTFVTVQDFYQTALPLDIVLLFQPDPAVIPHLKLYDPTLFVIVIGETPNTPRSQETDGYCSYEPFATLPQRLLKILPNYTRYPQYKRLNSIMTHFHIGIWEWRSSNQQIYCSPQTQKLLHHNQDYTSVRDLMRPLPVPQRKRLFSELKRCVYKQQPIHIQLRIPNTPQERIILVRGQGQWSHQGHFTGCLGSLEDISFQEDVHHKLRLHHNFLEFIIQNSPDLICVKNSDFDILHANRAFWDIFALKGRQNMAQDQACLNTGYAVCQEHYTTPAGPKVFRLERKRLEDPHQGTLILLIGTDVTDQESIIQELIDTNDDLESFVYTSSHDLKSPLRAIEMLSSWVIEDLEPQNIPAGIRDNILTIQRRARRMGQMLNDLLKYYRDKHTVYNIPKCDVIPFASLIAYVLELIYVPPQAQIMVKPTLVDINIPKEPLGQVFQNFITNAIRHNDKEHIKIIISAEKKDTEYLFHVQDNGPGIPKASQKKIFDMFTTLKKEEEQDSSGIGLALVKKVIDKLGGRIIVTSRPDQGCTFTFSLPLQLHSLALHKKV